MAEFVDCKERPEWMPKGTNIISVGLSKDPEKAKDWDEFLMKDAEARDKNEKTQSWNDYQKQNA